MSDKVDLDAVLPVGVVQHLKVRRLTLLLLWLRVGFIHGLVWITRSFHLWRPEGLERCRILSIAHAWTSVITRPSCALGWAQVTPIDTQSAELQALETKRTHLGPVAGPASDFRATKALGFALPPGAAADISAGTRPFPAGYGPGKGAAAPRAAFSRADPRLPAGVAAPAPALPAAAGRAA